MNDKAEKIRAIASSKREGYDYIFDVVEFYPRKTAAGKFDSTAQEIMERFLGYALDGNKIEFVRVEED